MAALLLLLLRLILLINLKTDAQGKLSISQKQQIAAIAQIGSIFSSSGLGYDFQIANQTARNEALNNTLYTYKGNIIASDKVDNDKVVVLSDEEANAIFADDQVLLDPITGEEYNHLYEETHGLFIVPEDKINEFRSASLAGYGENRVYDLNNKNQYEYLRSQTDMNYELNTNQFLHLQTGIKNNFGQSQESAHFMAEYMGMEKGTIGVINNDTDGFVADIGEYLDEYGLKDALNAYQYKQLQKTDKSHLILLHSAGNEDAHKALSLTALQGGQLDKLNFISIGSPRTHQSLDKVMQKTNSNFISQHNNFMDPVTGLNTHGAIMLTYTGIGLFTGLKIGAAMGGAKVGAIGAGVGGILGLGYGAGKMLYNINRYHPIKSYMEKDYELPKSIYDWTQFNHPQIPIKPPE